MSTDLDESGGSLVEASFEERVLPAGVKVFRCVYCNFQMATEHYAESDCRCEPEWCPNGCEHAYGDHAELEPEEIDPADGWVPIRKRPVEVEARKVAEREEIDTREGTVVAQQGDFVIRGVEGEEYPIDPEILAATYERVEADEEGPS